MSRGLRKDSTERIACRGDRDRMAQVIAREKSSRPLGFPLASRQSLCSLEDSSSNDGAFAAVCIDDYLGDWSVSKHAPRTPRLERLYHEYLVDQDSSALVCKVALSYTTGTLERLLHTASRMGRRAAALALAHLGDYGSNHALGMALHDPDRAVRLLTENAIRRVWCRDGSEQQQQALGIIIRLNSERDFEEAGEQADHLIAEAPHFAEAWNQRAIAYYSLGQFHRSIDDCRQAVELNPYHFGAVAGMGQCYLQLGNEVWALDCFRRALNLNPNLDGIRANVSRLERRLRRQ